jgi:hypothetical protein
MLEINLTAKERDANVLVLALAPLPGPALAPEEVAVVSPEAPATIVTTTVADVIVKTAGITAEIEAVVEIVTVTVAAIADEITAEIEMAEVGDTEEDLVVEAAGEMLLPLQKKNNVSLNVRTVLSKYTI